MPTFVLHHMIYPIDKSHLDTVSVQTREESSQERKSREQQIDPRAHTSEEPRHDDNSGPRSHQKSPDKKSIDKQ
jgi:hypothetical protein